MISVLHKSMNSYSLLNRNLTSYSRGILWVNSKMAKLSHLKTYGKWGALYISRRTSVMVYVLKWIIFHSICELLDLHMDNDRYLKNAACGCHLCSSHLHIDVYNYSSNHKKHDSSTKITLSCLIQMHLHNIH